jgi:hypothetical protein
VHELHHFAKTKAKHQRLDTKERVEWAKQHILDTLEGAATAKSTSGSEKPCAGPQREMQALCRKLLSTRDAAH